MVCMQRSQRTGLRDLVDDPAQHVAAVVDDGAVRVRQQAGARVVHRDGAGIAAQRLDGGRHVLGVERAGDLQGTQPRALGRLRGEGVELLERAGGDDLAGAVLVGRGEPVLAESGEYVVPVAAEDGRHPGGGDRGGGGHGPTPLADEDHRLLGADHPGRRGGGELTDASARRRRRPCRRRPRDAGRP